MTHHSKPAIVSAIAGEGPGADADGTASGQRPAPPTAPPLPPSPPPYPEEKDRSCQEIRSSSSPDPVAAPVGGREAGEGVAIPITNAEFVTALFSNVPEGASAVVCTKPGDPTKGGWHAVPADDVARHCLRRNNNYVNCSTFFRQADGAVRARLDDFAALQFVALDDLGTKVPLELLGDFELSWLLETSPKNFQGGILLKEPIRDRAEAKRLLDKIIAKGLCDKGAGGVSRWARLPDGINGKGKYIDDDGAPFRCRLVVWRPDRRHAPGEIVAALQLETSPRGRGKPVKSAKPSSVAQGASSVFIPTAEENPVVLALRASALYKRALVDGKHEISCPWLDEHTDRIDTGAAYFEPDHKYPFGGFVCQHSHRDRYHIGDLLNVLNVSGADARHVATIRLQPGEIDRIVSAAEQVLAGTGRYFQYGGLIASVVTDVNTGDPAIVPANNSTLERELSALAQWERYDRKEGWTRCDPPARHVRVLADAKQYAYLKVLAGVARQPYFRESDGGLVTSPGYDVASRRFGVFDSSQFALGEVTEEAARASLAMLDGLLDEFTFSEPCDRAAALAAMLTAAVRPSLPHAPAFHVSAPNYGSGKSYLTELIGLFAGPAGNVKTSYPMTPEEATKSMLSLLLTGPAVIDFDDMATDWIAHGTINRMLTAQHITDRILGFSKVATVSTRTLVLGSGNNVGPARDLLRRVLTIRLDPRCATPATKRYSGSPVQEVRTRRPEFVMAALTIIAAWRRAGCTRADVKSIVTYGGEWSDYCRFPLLWLGRADPATRLIEQIQNDPDSDALQVLMYEWYAVFGSTAVTVRRAVHEAENGEDGLLEAVRDLHITERDGSINRSKFGQFLKRNAKRIVAGRRFEQTRADGRVAWQVLPVETPASPPSPPSGDEDQTAPAAGEGEPML